jgi:hypothetical protein
MIKFDSLKISKGDHNTIEKIEGETTFMFNGREAHINVNFSMSRPKTFEDIYLELHKLFQVILSIESNKTPE